MQDLEWPPPKEKHSSQASSTTRNAAPSHPESPDKAQQQECWYRAPGRGAASNTAAAPLSPPAPVEALAAISAIAAKVTGLPVLQLHTQEHTNLWNRKFGHLDRLVAAHIQTY